MCQIYGMETLLNTAQPQTVWDSHMSTTLRAHSLTLAQLCLLYQPGTAPDMPIAELEVRKMQLRETGML